MVRHAEFIIKGDYTTWGIDMEDFANEIDDPDVTLDYICDWIEESPQDLYNLIQITNIWYEED